MARARFKNKVIAESDDVEIVEGNVYFPPQSVNREFLKESDYRSTCPWKGEAYYCHVVVDGEENRDAAWFYPDPKKEAKYIQGYVAFWRGIEVEK